MTSLFEREGNSGSDQGHTRSGTPLLLPTNFPNLVHFLSREYLAPVECFGEDDKYFEDLLEMVPGRLPLLTPPVPEDVIDLVQKESENTARPVLIELDAAEFSDGPVPVLSKEGEEVQAPLTSEKVFAAALPTAVPATEIECVHFLSDTDFRQFAARPYGNTRDLSDKLTSVSPSLQADADSDIGTLQSWFSSLDQPPSPSPEKFTNVDETAGAAALMAYLFADISKEDISEEVLGLLRGQKEEGDRLPSWISLSINEPSVGVPISNGKSDHFPDDLTFRIASSILRSKTPNYLVPSQALNEIRGSLHESEGLSDEDQTGLQKGAERISAILSNEAPFEGVKSDRYPALQGLMFFLIKERPEPLLEWDPSDTGASMNAHLAAAAYCGFVYGHASLPLEFRSEDLDNRLASWAVERLKTFFPSGTDPEECEAASRTSAHSSQLESSSPPLLSRFFSEDLGAEGPVREAAIELCRRKGWSDCIETEVFAPDRSEAQVRVTNEGGDDHKLKTAWCIPGVAEFKYNLDSEHFRSKVNETDLEDGLIEEIFEQYGIPRTEAKN